MIRPRLIIFLLALLLVLGCVGALIVGSLLQRPTQSEVGPPPHSSHLESVEFASASGSLLKGWLGRRATDHGVIILMHGIRANRTSMLSRAGFLAEAGYSVLLFDFQSHGESVGARQGFGALERMDATAAFGFIRSRFPEEPVGIIGTSLGGVAAILASPPMEARALVAEAVFPTIEAATANRIAMRFGSVGRLLTPLLIWPMRLGIPAAGLRPVDRIPELRGALLLIAGSADRDTTPQDSRRLFGAAPEPKEFWEIDGAGHVDFHAFARAEYERRVLEFLNRYVRKSPVDG